MRRVAALAVVLVLVACGGQPTSTRATSTPGGVITTAQPPRTQPPGPATGSRAIVELERGGSFTIELRPDKAPTTVARFASKARSGFYNGLKFHRVEDWVVQGGDPLGTGTGGERVPSEYNDLTFRIGAVGVARGQDPALNNDSQWFVVKKDSTFLDRQYTNFGTVTQGMDVVEGIKIGDKMKAVRVE